MNTIKRIEICGIIASGKTSLAKMLAEKLSETDVLCENFNANPFLESFYRDPEKFSFETEVSFLLQHYSDIKAYSGDVKLLVCDYALILDEAFANVTLKGSQRQTFLNVHSEVLNEIGPPDLVIHLNCPPEVALERIRSRNRTIEQTIPLEYLRSLDNAISEIIESLPKKVDILSIDTHHRDYVNSSTEKSLISKDLSHLFGVALIDEGENTM